VFASRQLRLSATANTPMQTLRRGAVLGGSVGKRGLTRFVWTRSARFGQVAAVRSRSDSSEGQFRKAHLVAALALATGLVGFAAVSSHSPKDNLLCLKKSIGRGSFGTVKEAQDLSTERIVAVKILDDAKLDPKLIEKEIGMLERVQKAGGHKNIVGYLSNIRNADRFEQKQQLQSVFSLSTLWNRISNLNVAADSRGSFAYKSPQTWILFEHVPGEELFEMVSNRGPLTEDSAAIVARQVAEGLDFLHKKAKVVHGDIKPENLIVTEIRTVKICDFGSSAAIMEDNISLDMRDADSIGTSAYCAPEVLTVNGILSPEIDVWGLGCVLYISLCGLHPFDLDGDRTDDEVAEAAASEPVRFDDVIWNDVSESAKDLVKRMLEKDASKRITVGEALKHPFLSNR